MEQQKCAMAEFRKSNVFNESWNFIEISYWKFFISNIQPRHTSTALAAHLSAAAHRLGSTAITDALCLCFIEQCLNVNMAKINANSRWQSCVNQIS